MKIVKHTGGLPTLFDEMQDTLNAVLKDGMFSPEFMKQNLGVAYSKAAYPKTDMYYEDGKIVLEADIQGLKKSEVSVDLEPSETRNESYLVISGGKKEHPMVEGRRYVHKEIKRSTWRRSWSLDENRFDVSKISADVKDGLLTVSIPEWENKEVNSGSKKIL